MTLSSSKHMKFEILMTMNSSLLGYDAMYFHIQMPVFWRNWLPSPTLKMETAGSSKIWVDCVWNVMAHAQKPDFIFCRNGWVHLNQQSTADNRGVRISISNAGYTTFRGSVRVLATHSISQFPLHFPSHASPCAIRFQMHSTYLLNNTVSYQRRLLPCALTIVSQFMFQDV